MSKNRQTLAEIKRGVDIGIVENSRRIVADALGQLLCDEHVLYIKLRNYHWNVQGMSFGPLHEMFEQQYTMLSTTIDDVAERIRSLGFMAPGSMEEFMQSTRLVETDHLDGNAPKMITNLLQDHEAIIQIMRHDIDEAEQQGDVGTADFLTAQMEMHEKMAWMLRAHLA